MDPGVQDLHLEDAAQRLPSDIGLRPGTLEVMLTPRQAVPPRCVTGCTTGLNPAGYCGIGGTGVKLSDPSGMNWGAACPTGIAPAGE